MLRRGSGEEGADLFSLGSCERTHGNGSKLHQGRFRQDIREHFFAERVVKHWNRLPRDVINSQAYQCLRGIRTMPLTTCFNLVSPEVLRQLDYRIVVGPFQLKQSYSVLFCPVLFYFNRYIVELSPVTVSSVNRKTEKFKYTLLFPSKKKNNIEKTF